MSDSTSSGRHSEPSPDVGKPKSLPVAENDASGPADPPTVISQRPLAPFPQLSDSACRILQGKILPGDRLEHFELVSYIGGGGMGRVFRGVDTRLRRDVALKILSPDQAADDETLLRFQNEAQSAARLDHENIARVYHVGEDRGLHYIVFEFIEGDNIRRLVEQTGPLPLAQAISYTLQVAEALVHADARSVVHRDIKPSNLLITPEGQVKLIDMGLARLRRLNPASADLTQSGVTLGTFDYIAPEQARDPRDADVRSDIYSLGCTLFFMLAGRPPFPEGTMLQKLLQHQADRPPDIREFRPDLPEDVSRVLRKMMAKDPRQRYPNPTALVEELMLLAYQVGLRSSSGALKAVTPPRGRTVSFIHRNVPWLAPVVILIAVAVGIHVFPGRGEPSPPWPEPVAAQTNPPTAPRTSPDGTASASDPVEVLAPGEVDVDASLPSPERRAGGAGPTGLAEDPGLSARTPPANGTAEAAAEGNAPGPGRDVPESLAGGGETLSSAGATVTPSRTNLLVVCDNPVAENEYSSLHAACRVAVNGDVIDLRYNGRREEQPITLANLSLTIQASKGFVPIVAFRPDQSDPVKYARSMFTLTAGRLKLSNLNLELYVPREIAADSWSLAEIRGDQRVRLEKCTLSVCNASDWLTAYHPDVAFFRARSLADSSFLAGEQSLTAIPSARIDLVNCVARGEAAFLSAADLQPVHLLWQNGLLVTSEQLLRAFGSRETPLPGETLQIELFHLTAVVQGGFCRMTQTPDLLYLKDTHIYCDNSILMAANGAPLIFQEGIDSPESLRQQITWKGDHNFYEDFDVLWSICGLDQQLLADPMSFAIWESYWGEEAESVPVAGGVVWRQLPDGGRPFHTHTPADYVLADSVDTGPNPAGNVGAQATTLPECPAPADWGEPLSPSRIE